MKPSDLDQLLSNESFRRRNPHLIQVSEPIKPVKEQVAIRETRIRQESKPLMNKLEAEWLEHLKRLVPEMKSLRAQAKRFRLGNGIWYRPDFTGLIDNYEWAWEVKGPHAFRGGFENLKVAASLYPEIHWVLAWKDNGEWKEQEVKS